MKPLVCLPSENTLLVIETLRLNGESVSGCIDRLLSNLAIFIDADNYAEHFGEQRPNIRRRARGTRNKRRGT